MTILLPTLAVAFAAFCVWLTVRIVNRRERWAKWTLATLIVIAVLYPLSVGPANWLYVRLGMPEWLHQTIAVAYDPLWKSSGAMPQWLVDLYWNDYTRW